MIKIVVEPINHGTIFLFLIFVISQNIINKLITGIAKKAAFLLPNAKTNARPAIRSSNFDLEINQSIANEMLTNTQTATVKSP